MKEQKLIEYWAHMLDESFLEKEYLNDKEQFSKILETDDKSLDPSVLKNISFNPDAVKNISFCSKKTSQTKISSKTPSQAKTVSKDSEFFNLSGADICTKLLKFPMKIKSISDEVLAKLSSIEWIRLLKNLYFPTQTAPGREGRPRYITAFNIAYEKFLKINNGLNNFSSRDLALFLECFPWKDAPGVINKLNDFSLDDWKILLYYKNTWVSNFNKWLETKIKTNDDLQAYSLKPLLTSDWWTDFICKVNKEYPNAGAHARTRFSIYRYFYERHKEIAPKLSAANQITIQKTFPGWFNRGNESGDRWYKLDWNIN